MEDNKLFYHKDLIYTIYREQSFSRAAKKLYISQPSLSVIVKKLEDEIGQPLFDRSCKPIRLTEVGEAYIKAASDIQNTEDKFLEYIGALDNLDAGSLRIGSNQLLSSFVLPKYVAEFMRQYPNIKISILDASSPTLENAINLGDVDIVIDNQELDDEFYVNKQLTTEYLLLAVPTDFPCNEKLKKFQLSYKDVLEGRRLDSVEDVPLKYFESTPFALMTKDNDTRTRTDAIFKDAGFSPKVILELDRLITQYNFLMTFSAASIVSNTLIKHVSGLAGEGESHIVFYKLPLVHAERKIVLSYKKIKHYSKSMDAFAKIMKDFN